MEKEINFSIKLNENEAKRVTMIKEKITNDCGDWDQFVYTALELTNKLWDTDITIAEFNEFTDKRLKKGEK